MLIRLFGLVATIALLGGLGAYTTLKTDTKEDNLRGNPLVWVEILQNSVFIDGQTLVNGDEVPVGSTLSSSATGKAVLHFPDGSDASIEPDTTLTLTDASYNQEDKGIISQLLLTAGKVFVSITELATPESSWEVKTGNAVAVVRGTAFSVSFFDGLSEIDVTEDTVTVATLNLETGEVIPGTEVSVVEGATATVTDEDAEAGANPTVTEKSVQSNRGTKQENEQETSPSVIPQATQASPPTTTVTPQRLELEGSISTNVTEGDTITFTAFLVLSDGSRRNVTNQVSWDVLGPIGGITTGGRFTAQLESSVSEFGVSSGAVIATWTDEATNAALLGQTDIFEVKAFIEEVTDQRG